MANKYVAYSTYVNERDEISIRVYIQEKADAQNVKFIQFFNKFAKTGLTNRQAKIFALHHGFGELDGVEYGPLSFVTIASLLISRSKNDIQYSVEGILFLYNSALKELANAIPVLHNSNEKILSPSLNVGKRR